MMVPYAMACSVWNVPWAPVMPWQMTRVDLSIRMDIQFARGQSGLDLEKVENGLGAGGCYGEEVEPARSLGGVEGGLLHRFHPPRGFGELPTPFGGAPELWR